MLWRDPLTSWLISLLSLGSMYADEKIKEGNYKAKTQIQPKKTHPEPHRDKDGKIIIENGLLYEKDYEKYGAYQVMQWVKEGRYNLSSEELEKEKERIAKKYEYLDKLHK